MATILSRTVTFVFQLSDAEFHVLRKAGITEIGQRTGSELRLFNFEAEELRVDIISTLKGLGVTDFRPYPDGELSGNKKILYGIVEAIEKVRM